MSGLFNDSRLQIIATQLASVRAKKYRRNFIVRAASRIKRVFLQESREEKVRFARYAVRESLLRLSNWLHSKRLVEVPQDRLLVVARCNGGLGDLIICSAFLNRFYRECGHPVIHVVVPTLRLEEAEFVFHNSPAVALVTNVADFRRASTPYDVILNLGVLVSYDFIRKERVHRIAPEVLEKLTAATQIQDVYRAIIEAQPSWDGLFATIAVQSGLRRLDLLGWLGNVGFTQAHQLSASPQADGYRRFEELGLANRPYITIHNGWDNVAYRDTKSTTKGWPPSHCGRFVAAFKERFPQVLIVQLGAKTSRPIVRADIGLLDDTTLHEAAWILKHSLLHVDGDSGLVHLARALHTKSLVLFGPTNHEFFRYAQNENCFSTTCSNCWWSTHDWMRSCPRGLQEPECMKSIEPAEVLDRAVRYLRLLPSLQVKVEGVENWQSPSPGTASGGNPPQKAPFGEWRRRFVLDALRSAQATKADIRVAIVDGAGLLASQLAAAGYAISTFSFKTEHESRTDSIPGSGMDLPGKKGGKLAWDYGSCYNIPAENDEFDVVITPLLTDRIQYPYAAIKESLRVLKETGLLVLTYRLAGGMAHTFNGDGDGPARALFRALEDLGAADGLVRAAAGGLVLRKSAGGRLFAKKEISCKQEN
ncbi:MAG: glycosyltransferase family 9 protein [Thermoguttaceae bacterium]